MDTNRKRRDPRRTNPYNAPGRSDREGISLMELTEMFPYFEIGAVTPSGAIGDYQDAVFEKLPTRARLRVREGDILFARNNSSRGVQVRWSGRPLPTASRCAKMVLKRFSRPSEGGGIHVEEVTIIGIDLAKRSFQVHGARADGSVAFRRKFSRGKLVGFLGLYKYGNHLTPGLAEVSASGCGLHLLPG